MNIELVTPEEITILQNHFQALSGLIETEPIHLEMPQITVVIKNEDSIIGSLSLFNIDGKNHKAEFGISIYSNHGTQCAVIAAKQFIKNAYQMINLNRIYCKIHSDNERALQLAKRAGFVFEGEERQSIMIDNQYIDLKIMSMLRDEFERKWL